MTSYLAWPIQLAEPLHYPKAHVTLKYLGHEPYSVDNLTERLRGIDLRLTLTGSTFWRQELFYPDIHCMTLEGLHMRSLLYIREKLHDLRKDDFTPWRPHVSVDFATCLKIKHLELTPKKGIESIGPLTLYLGGLPVHTFVSEAITA